MHIKFALLAIAAAVAGGLQDLWPLRLTLGWVALCFAWLSLAYAFVGPSALLKTGAGRLSPLSLILLAPYHALNTFSLWLCRFSSEPAYQEIVPGLYLGRRLQPAQARALQVSAVLDVTAELNECSAFLRADVTYLLLPTLDKCPLQPEQMERAVEFITRSLQSGSVYVHCALGHGRSASVVAAYLLASRTVGSVDEAETWLRKIRPQVKLNGAQKCSVA